MALASFIPLSGCGVKADPEPPAAEVKPVPRLDGLSARGQGGKITLRFKAAPAELEDAVVAGFRVYRKDWAEGANPEQAQVLMMADLVLEAGKEAEIQSFQDNYIEAGKHYEYHLFAYNAKKTLGPDNTLGPFVADFPEKAPEGFGARSENGVAVIFWNTPDVKQRNVQSAANALAEAQGQPVTAALPGQSAAPAAEEKADEASPEAAPASSGPKLNLYRAEGKEGPYDPKPINAEPALGGEFRDNKVSLGLEIRYRAREVREENGVVMEGPFTEEIALVVEDKTPPQAPDVLWVKALEKGVRIRWSPVQDPALLGYRVERKKASDPDTAFADISGIVTVDEFTDRKVTEKAEYAYRVTAKDRGGNQAQSAAMVVDFPPPEPVEPAPLPTENAEGAPAAVALPVAGQPAEQPAEKAEEKKTPPDEAKPAAPAAPKAPALPPPSEGGPKPVEGLPLP